AGAAAAARPGGQAMELVVVSVPDCPNAPILERRLAQALAETGIEQAASIARRVVSDGEQAARRQMRGSPTQPIAVTTDAAATPGELRSLG
ncbi:hypothetical protein, partial [Nonomuraea sp. 10N515B]|uniref:hypothetical protein n=1 Tax=Nonomuraea sp. 10N515B TaxID=3457422 RepID=UPI003FCC40EA